MRQDYRKNHTYTEEDISRVLGREMQPSEQVERRLDEVYAQVRSGQTAKKKRSFRGVYRAAGAAAAVFAAGVFCVSNPALAAKIPVIGHIFEQMGEQASFPGDYGSVATVLQTEGEQTEEENGKEAQDEAESTAQQTGAAVSEYTQTAGDLTVSLSEVYGNSEALYLSMQVVSKEGFEPERCMVNQNGNPVLALRGEVDFSFLRGDWQILSYLDGSFLDDHTYVGMMRLDLSDYKKDDSEFWKEVEKTAEEKGEELSMEEISKLQDEKYEALTRTVDIPEEYTARLKINQIIGDLADGYRISIYEAAGVEQPSEEELTAMSDEEWRAYMNELDSKVPDYGGFPNKYENFWYDGPFEFEVPVTLDSEQTTTVEINSEVVEGYEILSVTKTPFELVVNEKISNYNSDLMIQVLDADGKRLNTGANGGYVNVLSSYGHDLSKVDIYYMTWDDFETYTKGTYWEEHETNEEGKTLKNVLDEHNVYHKEVVFDK